MPLSRYPISYKPYKVTNLYATNYFKVTNVANPTLEKDEAKFQYYEAQFSPGKGEQLINLMLS